MCPSIITSVIPSAIYVFIEICLKTEIILLVVRNLSVAIDTITHIIINTAIIPILPFIIEVNGFLFPNAFTSLFFSLILLYASCSILHNFFLIHLVFSKLSNKLTCSYNTNVITHVDNLRQFT